MYHLSCMMLHIPNPNTPACMHHTPGHPCSSCHAVEFALFTVSFMLGVSTGDRNCFYRAELAAVVEGLCHDPRPAHIAALSRAFHSQQLALESCPIVNRETRAVALQGHNFLQVPCICLSAGSSLMQLLHKYCTALCSLHGAVLM